MAALKRLRSLFYNNKKLSFEGDRFRGYPAFTLIEIIITITIIGILSIISAVSFNDVQVDVRDQQRRTQLVVVSEALERYYIDNGEYPGCNSMSQSVSTLTSDILPGLDPETLKTPSDDNGVNSFLAGCADLTGDIDKYAYVGLDTPDCTSGDSCYQYTLKYREEATGNIISIDSIHRAAVADTPTEPSLSVGFSGGVVLAEADGSICDNGSVQFAFSYRLNDGSWSGYGPWSISSSTTQIANDGTKYEYIAMTRCYINETIYSPTSESNTASYIDPIPAPDAPVVVATNNGDDTTFAWVEPTCSVGDVSSQYRYTVTPSGYDSGWVGVSDSDVTFTTVLFGQTYTVAVQSMCENAFASSPWSIEGSADYAYSTFLADYAAYGASNIVSLPGGDYLINMNYGLARIRQDGAVVWGKNYDVNDDSKIYGIALDQNGDIIAVGGTRHGCCSWIATLSKLDIDGNLIWYKEHGPTELYNSIVIDNSNNFYAVGTAPWIGGDSDDRDLVIGKYNSEGEVLWQRYWGQTSENRPDYGTSIALVSGGGVVATGTWGNGAGYGYGSGYLIRYDQNGNLLWNTQFGSRPASYVVELSDGSFVVVGGGRSWEGDDDNRAFIAKFGSDGTMLWSKEWYGLNAGEDNYNRFSSVAQKPDGKIVVVGNTDSFGNENSWYPNRSVALIAQYDIDGNLEWSKIWTARNNNDQSYGRILISDSQSIIVTGSKSYSGGSTVLLAKYSSDGELYNCTSPNCQSVTPLISSGLAVDYNPGVEHGILTNATTNYNIANISTNSYGIGVTYIVSQ